MAICDMPDGPRAYISGKSPTPMLQPLHVMVYVNYVTLINTKVLLITLHFSDDYLLSESVIMYL